MLEVRGPLGLESTTTKTPDFVLSRILGGGFRYWHSIGDDEATSTLVNGGDSTYRREGVDVLDWLDWPAVAARWLTG